jgi:predicted branched-subunit amino acid permease
LTSPTEARLAPLASPLRQGFLESFPFLGGTLAWGAVFGAAAVLAGLGQVAAIVMSAIVWSGTAQLAVVKILALPLGSIFATSLLLSLRFVPMVLGVNHLLALPRWKRVLISCTIVDASFFLAVRRRWDQGGLGPYLIGAWVAQYGTWVLGTVAGANFGTVVPTGWLHTVEGFTVVIFVVLAAEICTTGRMTAAALLGAAIGLLLARVAPVGIAMVVAALVAGALAMPRRQAPA